MSSCRLCRLVGFIAAVLQWMPCQAQSASTLRPPGQGEVRAFVVGIDQYATLQTLKGAVADARDLEAAMRKAGVANLTVLTDREATRQRVESEMNRLVTEAQRGDLVIISFAGHGAQQPEQIKGSKPDGMDDFFVLSGFSNSGSGTRERVLGQEFNAWLSRLDKKGAHVVFVADACHGGGLTRDVDLRAGDQSYRAAGVIKPTDDDLKPISSAADAKLTANDFENVTFLAAVDKRSKAPEVKIPGNATLRGALSYAVARAIEGGLVGSVTRRQLFSHARQLVYQYSGTRQAILTEPLGGSANLDAIIYRSSLPSQSVQLLKIEPVKLRIENGSSEVLRGVSHLSVPFEVTKAESVAADIIWDVGKSEIISAQGDVVARGIGPKDIPAVVDRTAAVGAISKISEAKPQTIVLLPNSKQHRNNEQVEFVIEQTDLKHLILFNLAGDGTVQFLYPTVRDKPDRLLRGAAFRLPLKVQEPFGADYVVAIVSPERHETIEREIAALDGRKTAGDLLPVLARLQSARITIGTAGLFTGP
jgi:hypothetical protein